LQKKVQQPFVQQRLFFQTAFYGVAILWLKVIASTAFMHRLTLLTTLGNQITFAHLQGGSQWACFRPPKNQRKSNKVLGFFSPEGLFLQKLCLRI
jgi:hypothetical protein